MKTKLNKQVVIKVALAAAVVSLVFSVIGQIPILQCINCFTWPIVFLVLPAGVGFYAVKQHGITKVDLVEGLFVGGIAGVVAGLACGVVSFVVGFIGSLIWSGVGSALSSSSVTDAFGNAASTATYSIIGAIFSTIGSVVAFAVISAIAGLVAAAINDPTKGTAKPAMPADKQ